MVGLSIPSDFKRLVAGERYHKGNESAMASTNLDLGEELCAVLEKLGQPVEQMARERIVLELYRRSLISSGKAAELLGLERLDFIRYASDLGIPYFRFTENELQAEVAESKRT
jgi:predicted HTH domain antitoxin